MEIDINNNELAIAKYKLLKISRFLHRVESFQKEDLIDFFRLLSPSEQYYLFDKLSEEQKLIILAKKNVLSPDVYVDCCKKTDTFNNNILLSTQYYSLKRWGKNYKNKADFGRKMVLLVAILKNFENLEKELEKELEKILFREKLKRISKQILFFVLFVFCSASFGIGAYLGKFFIGGLSVFIEYGIITLGSAITLKSYDKIRESYLRESKLIKMLSWMKKNEVFKKNKKISEPPVITYLNNLNNENHNGKNSEIDIDEKLLNFKQNAGIAENLFEVSNIKYKKSKLKKATKIIFYISVFLTLAVVVASSILIPGVAALMQFVVSIFALKIFIATLAIVRGLTLAGYLILWLQVQRQSETIKKLRAESPLSKDLSKEIVEEAAKNLSEKPNLENEKENVK